MTQLVLPNTIDAGTEITAAEHQSNYVAIRNVINGGLEGGTTADSNIRANGVTGREIDDTVLAAMMRTALQAGVVTSADLKITLGAGLQLNYAAGAAWVADTSSIVSTISGTLIPVVVAAASTVTIGANATGNPRIDQVILTLTGYNTGTVSVVPGVATVGATIDNRLGAAALPASSIRLADILMPTGFAGPFVQNTHIRDRRPWARGAHGQVEHNGSLNCGPVGTTLRNFRLETSGGLVRVRASGIMFQNTTGATQAPFYGIRVDGAVSSGNRRSAIAGNACLTGLISPMMDLEFILTIAAGTHKFDFTTEWGGDLSGSNQWVGTANERMFFEVQEYPTQDFTANPGA